MVFVKSRTSTKLVFSLLFYLVYIFMPITRMLTSVMKASIIGAAILLLFFHLAEKKNRILKTVVFSLGIIALDFLIYYGVWRSNNAVNIVDKNLMLFVFWMPLLYAEPLMESSPSTKKKIFRIYLLFFSVEIITTLIGNLMFPMASRDLASTQDIIQNRLYQMMNIGGYGFIYALVLSLPIWIYLSKFINKKYVLYVLFSLGVIAVASYMTAIALALLTIVVSLARSPKRAIIWGAMMMIVFIVSENFLAGWLNNLSEMLYSSDNHILGERISNISTAVFSGETTGDMGYRDELRNSSFEAFWSSPLYGNLLGSYKTLGLHSEFVDWLGGMGLFGVFFAIIVLQNRIRRYISDFKKTRMSFYVKTMFLVCFVLGFLNLITTAPEFSTALFILPVLMMSITTQQKEKIVNIKRL